MDIKVSVCPLGLPLISLGTLRRITKVKRVSLCPRVPHSYPKASMSQQVHLFKFKLLSLNKIKHSVPVTLATFPVLLSHMWLVAMVLDSTATEHFYHCRKICWTAPF